MKVEVIEEEPEREEKKALKEQLVGFAQAVVQDLNNILTKIKNGEIEFEEEPEEKEKEKEKEEEGE